MKIELFLLGAIDLRREDGVDVQALLGQNRVIGLLAFLVIGGAGVGTYHRRDRLVGIFWPETDQRHARTSLRKLVHAIRQALGDDVLESRGDEELRVAPERLWCDVVELEDSAARGQLARADELYRGELMPGFHLSGTPSPEFDRWLSNRRMQLAELAADGALALARRLEGESRVTKATSWARRAARLALDDERKCRAAIELLARAGDTPGALHLHAELCRRLAELGARPSPETRALIEQIRNR